VLYSRRIYLLFANSILTWKPLSQTIVDPQSRLLSILKANYCQFSKHTNAIPRMTERHVNAIETITMLKYCRCTLGSG